MTQLRITYIILSGTPPNNFKKKGCKHEHENKVCEHTQSFGSKSFAVSETREKTFFPPQRTKTMSERIYVKSAEIVEAEGLAKLYERLRLEAVV